ncbi:uncharacterized protein LOC129960452 [Argiope bruennichi]|uniref:Uncharacterized protein n=1 Tax=Argiope bruennichi TaxID=94029 RepID=A0A8T0FMZ6_ARGBR|nr:uncharacterized protein LOC129960452 [Argiope bruennichi]KAF8790949.1 hypothetical protein HNY73_005888 [Argiope bruennichi]
MFSPSVAFLLLMGVVHSSISNYPQFNAIKQLSDMENNLDPLKTSANRMALQSNRVVGCDMEEIVDSVGLNDLQDLIEAVALRKGTNPFAILKTLYKRMKNREEIEENMLNSIDAIPLPELLSPSIMDVPPQPRFPPAPSNTPYSLPSNDPLSGSEEEDANVVIIPVAPADPIQNSFPNMFPPMMKPDLKVRNEAPFVFGNVVPTVPKVNHVLPAVFPIFPIPMKSNHLRPPVGATIRVNSGDDLNPINRDITVTVSPLMTIIEALRQAEIKYQNVLGLNHDMDVITFAHSLSIDCYTVNRINDVVQNEDWGWKITIMDRDGLIVYDGFCLPNGKDVLVKPGTLIYLSYVSLY